MEKLIKILDAHGIVYSAISEKEIRCFVYAFSNEYDTILWDEKMGGYRIFTPENEENNNVFQWLGY